MLKRFYLPGKSLFFEKAKAKNITLSIPKLEESIYVYGEKVGLTHTVFANLISNALKFSEEGSTITIKITSDTNPVRIEVSDFGIGIPKNLAGNLFDPYSPTTRKGLSGEKGTGFGLPLAKDLMGLYGGKLEVESRPIDEHPDDHGTTFTVVLEKDRSKKAV